ncbi:phosphatase domain-containing protein [Vitiosangium sp. GDMCC 1.1324]|uniref:phosphatase domain-containing protein n=1 Tax=Vitiosangium sp. (strain GDMCC 1.1324) TaxID=2138576 RepID=UPI001E37A2D5|nr:phosphatase domain-containing protein [Vitiosangium sp. GDMCC 1.1324]
MNAPARIAALVLALASATALAGPAVLLSPVLGRPESVTLHGRVLAETPHGSTALSRNLRRLAARNWKGARVEVSFLGVEALVTSGEDGEFQVTLQPPKGRTFPVGGHEARALVTGASASARVEILADTTPFLVVSDFDDTLAISEVTQPDKLVTNALLRDADTQKVVPGMAGFYGCLGTDAGAVPAFALVSGSPVQFGPRVGTFLARHGFPAGFGLYLRDLGPGTLSDYKQPIIRGLLQRIPYPVVLVGDSGEKDPEVYAQIRDEFPGRVRAIYIRDAGNSGDAARFKDMVLFKDASSAAEHAVQGGLARRACVSTAFPPVAPQAGAGVP